MYSLRGFLYIGFIMSGYVLGMILMTYPTEKLWLSMLGLGVLIGPMLIVMSKVWYEVNKRGSGA